MRIGIDAGGTLIKIVVENGGQRTYETRLTTDIENVANWLNEQTCSNICITGGNAKALNDLLHCDAKQFIEFDAADKGVELLLKEQGIALERYILLMLEQGHLFI